MPRGLYPFLQCPHKSYLQTRQGNHPGSERRDCPIFSRQSLTLRSYTASESTRTPSKSKRNNFCIVLYPDNQPTRGELLKRKGLAPFYFGRSVTLLSYMVNILSARRILLAADYGLSAAGRWQVNYAERWQFRTAECRPSL